MDGFLPYSQEIYNFFYDEQTERLLHETQKHDPVIRQLSRNKYKNAPLLLR